MLVRDNTENRIKYLSILSIILLLIGSYKVQTIIENKALSNIEAALNTVLLSTRQAIDSWSNVQRNAAETWAKNATTIDLVQDILRVWNTTKEVKSSSLQRPLRNHFKPVLKTMGYKGFFVISPNGHTLSSFRNSNLAKVNLLNKRKFLNKLKQGDSAISLPQFSDVPLVDKIGLLQQKLATMFVAAPVKNKKGKLLAFLAFRLDPAEDFSTIFNRGRIGATGETYAFDSFSRLISESRFNHDLIRMGIIKEGQQSTLNVVLNETIKPDNYTSRNKVKKRKNLMLKNTLNKKSGSNVKGYPDYRGIEVVGTWYWDDDKGFGITTEIDKEEAYDNIDFIKKANFSVTGISILIIIFINIIKYIGQQRLNESEKRNKEILKNIGDAIFTINKSGVILSCNIAAEEIFGYDSEELIGNNITMLMLGKDKAMHSEYVLNHRSSEQAIMGGSRFVDAIRKDGEKICVYASISEMEVKGEKQFIGSLRDVTYERDAKRELQASEAFNRILFEDLPIGIALCDRDGQFIDVNKAYADIIGRTVSEILEMNHLDIIPEKNHKQEIMFKLQLDSNGRQGPSEKEYINNVGMSIPVSVTSIYVKRDGVKHILSIAENITKRVIQTNQLEKSRSTLIKAQKIASLGSWTLEVETGDIQWSDEVYRIYEIEGNSDTPISDLFMDMIHPNDREHVDNAIRQSINNNGISYKIHYRLLLSDGNVKHIYAQGEVERDNEGKAIRLIGTILDTTQQHLNEEMLEKRTHELKRSNDELEQFAYVASHDLQEPLRMVSSYLTLVSNRYNDKLDEDGKEFIFYAVDGAKRMQDLIQALLTYSRLNTKKEVKNSVECDQVLQSVLVDLQVTIKESEAEITFQKLPEIHGNKKQLVQLFQNLVSNAIKYHGEKAPEVIIGVADLSAENIPFEKSGLREGWLFSVKDNGIGIKEEFLERVFRIFERLHTKDEYSGTGIGLSICRRVVENHGGRIWVESEPDKGTCFYFTIPYNGVNNTELDK